MKSRMQKQIFFVFALGEYLKRSQRQKKKSELLAPISCHSDLSPFVNAFAARTHVRMFVVLTADAQNHAQRDGREERR